MSRETLEQWRLPAGILLLAIVAFFLFPRGEDGDDAATPSPTVIAGQPGGEVISPEPTDPPAPSAEPTAEPTETPEATETSEPTEEPEDTPAPTPPPARADGFTAEVLACRSISGSTCNGRLGTLPAGASSFTALVRFTDATAGDTMNAVLDGPSGRIDGFPYTLQGGGDGYYYSQFQAGGLPAGSYTLTALRNGETVATTTFRKAG
jgi:hypothetical protein